MFLVWIYIFFLNFNSLKRQRGIFGCIQSLECESALHNQLCLSHIMISFVSPQQSSKSIYLLYSLSFFFLFFFSSHANHVRIIFYTSFVCKSEITQNTLTTINYYTFYLQKLRDNKIQYIKFETLGFNRLSFKCEKLDLKCI